MGRDLHTTRAFLEYLIECGVLDDEQALLALDRQRARTPPIGRILLLNRRMTMKQVFDTLCQQVDTHYRFGEQAVERGYLAADELQEVLELQDQKRPRICGILVELGFLDPESVDRYRNRFAELSAALLA